VLDGDLWPRWNPYLALGIPLLSFYGPIGYVAGWPAQALGASPLQAMATVLVLFQTLGAAAAYASVRWLGGSRGGGLLAAFAICLAPYHLMDQNFRLALGETLSFSLFLPVFAAGWKLASGDRGLAPWVLGCGMALLLLTHVLSAVMAVLGLLLILGLAPFSAARPDRRTRLCSSIGALLMVAVLTAGATAAWWLPVVVEQEHTSLSRLSRPGRAISPYAATADEVLRRQLWERYGVRRSLRSLWKLEQAHQVAPTDSSKAALEHERMRRRAMPLYFGWGMALLLLMGLSIRRDRGGGRSLALAGLALLVLSVWPVARLLDGLPLFGRIMFPWRLFAPATALAALAGGLSFRGGRLGLLALLGLVALDAAPFLGAADRYPAPPSDGFFVWDGDRAVAGDVPRDRFLRIEDAPLPPSDYGGQLAKSRWVFSEYMAAPLRERYGKLSRPPSKAESGYFGAEFRFSRTRATRISLPAEAIAEIRDPGGEWQSLSRSAWTLLPERITLQLPEGNSASDLRFKGAWFPGWEVRVDGGSWGAAGPSEEHLLTVVLPSGAELVEFRYAFWSRWPRSLGLGVSLFFLLGLVFRLRSFSIGARALGILAVRRQTVPEV